MTLCFQNSSAQHKKEEFISRLREKLYSFSTSEKLKDSIALYSFAIQIDIKKNKNSSIKNVTSNDSISNVVFKKNYLPFLKKLNYDPILGEAKNATIIIPVAYIVANYKADDISEKKVPITDLSDKLYKLFNYIKKDENTPKNYIYLKPMITVVDKAIYH